MTAVIEYNKSLQAYNTFGIDARAEVFVEVHTETELREALRLDIRPRYILGGGSNLLLRKGLKGLVIKNSIGGRRLEREFPHSVYIASGAGENWHQLVGWCIEQGYGGIENLSLIPGTVGAAPIQNIGAYGVELREVFHRLEALHLDTGQKRIFRAKDCQFGYRDSIFKRALKGQYCITKVVLKLSKPHRHRLRLSYGAIRQTLDAQQVHPPTIQTISQAVIAIRSSKLPDPAQLGNSGSFFKNPELSATHFYRLKAQFPHIVSYPLDNGGFKVPAGWLIEQCGWKGKRIGNTGAHARQALVLVNYGGATGEEIWTLAQQIIASVKQRFGVELYPEVNVW